MAKLKSFLIIFLLQWIASNTVEAGLFGNIISAIFGPSPSLNYSPYYKGAVCTPSDPIQHPQSITDVVSIVQGAIASGKTVKAFGHMHSITDIICTGGIPVDMRGIGGMVMNPDQSVTVGAGVNMYETTEFIKANGRAFRTTPAFGNITIGGALGTGAHGSSLRYTSSISEQVIGVTIVDGLGNIQNITSESDLNAFRIHLGLLGIILSVTLRTEPLYKVVAQNYVVSDQILLNGSFIDMVNNTDQISLYWFPSFNQVIVANWTIVDASVPGEAWTNDHVPSTWITLNAPMIPGVELMQALDALSAPQLNLVQALTAQSLLTTVPDMQPIYTVDGFTVEMPAVGYYNRMFAPICYDHGVSQCPWFWGPYNLTQLDNEMGIDIQKMPALAATVKDIVSKYAAVFPVYGILLRFSEPSNTYMSTAYGSRTCHFEFYMINRQDAYNKPSGGLAAYQTIMQAIAINYGGRSHWGKSGSVYHSTAALARSLNASAVASFVTAMAQYDPNGVFMNAFGARLKGTGTAADTDPKVTHCALLDNCICSKNSDCALGQICSYINGYRNFSSCITLGTIPGTVLDPSPDYEDLPWLQ